jgi:hypothetical protein
LTVYKDIAGGGLLGSSEQNFKEIGKTSFDDLRVYPQRDLHLELGKQDAGDYMVVAEVTWDANIAGKLNDRTICITAYGKGLVDFMDVKDDE